MDAADYLLLGVILYGHVALWIAAFNRTHAVDLPRKWIRFIELGQILPAVGLVYYIADEFIRSSSSTTSLREAVASLGWLAYYLFVCFGFAIWTTLHWMHRRFFVERPAQLLSNDTVEVDITKELGFYPMRGWSTRLFACLPTNQMFDLCVDVKTVQLPRLPKHLDGLSITHLSDLHLSGRITRPFFDYVMDRVIGLDSDLIAITGDIQDVEECYDWLKPLLGRLRAQHGVYFVLGNHDKRLQEPDRLRRELAEFGFVDLGRAQHSIMVQQQLVTFYGNELPWFGPPVEPTPFDAESSLRVLLSHTPDQIPWAKRHNFDLMLAGHTHGGHIRLPWIGPIVCPSRYGVKFASGMFFDSPTLMHVSRGVSGLDPLRFNCPPELTKLVLRSAAV